MGRKVYNRITVCAAISLKDIPLSLVVLQLARMRTWFYLQHQDITAEYKNHRIYTMYLYN